MSSQFFRARGARTRSPRIESLEDRCLLSAATPFTPAEYLAQFNGTAQVATLLKDDFDGAAGQVSVGPNSALEICVGDSQWRGLYSDIARINGQGDLTGVDADTTYAWTNLGPIPANSLLAVNTTICFPGGNNEKIAFGFGQGGLMLDDAANNSGPWVLINRGNNTITLYTSNDDDDTYVATFTAGFHNNEDRAVEFLYDVSTQSVHLTIGGEVLFGGWVDTELGTGADAVAQRNHFTMQIVDTAADGLIAKVRDIDVSMLTRPALVYLDDNFDGTGVAVTASARETDLQHTAWSGNATLTNNSMVGTDSQTRYASIDLAALGPDSVVSVTSSFTFTKGGYQKVSYGFSSDGNAFGANSGAWVQINRNGALTIYKGNTPVATATRAFTNNTTVALTLLYDVGSQQMAVQLDGTTIAFSTSITNGWVDTSLATSVSNELLRDRFTLQIDDTSADGGVAKINEVKVQVLSRRPPKNDFTLADTVTMTNNPIDAAANTEALWALVNGANNDNVIVKFAAGDYHFASAAHSSAEQILVFNNLANVKFEGGPGVNIWIDDMTLGFIRFNNCTNVEVSDMHIDYTTIPWGQGRIIDVNDDHVSGHQDGIIVQFDTGPLAGGGTLVAPSLSNPDALNADVIWGYSIQKDGNGNAIPGRMDENTAKFTTNASLITYDDKTGYYTLNFTGNMSETSEAEAERDTLDPDDLIVLHYRYNGSSLLKNDNCSNMTYRNLGIAAAPMVIFSGETTSEINILDCFTEIKAGRWKATDGDAVHFRSPRIGPWVEGCTFTGIGDDVANLYTLPFTVEAFTGNQAAGTTVLTLIKLTDYQISPPYSQYGVNDFVVGDHLTFFDPNTGQTMYTATVTAVNRASRQITIDRYLAAGSLTTGNSYLATTIFNDSLATSYMILDNDWTNSFRTFNAKAHNGQFIGNYFEGLGGPAIMVRNEPDYPEGLVPSNVIIKGNEFVNNGFQYQFLSSEYMCGTVDVHVARQVRSSNYTTLPLLTEIFYGPTDIKILDNIFSDWRLRAITAFNADRLDIIGNTFNNPYDGVVDGSLARIVDIYNCDHVTIDKSYYGGTLNNLVSRGSEIIANYGTINYYGFPAGSYLMAGGGESEAMLSTETLNALYDLVYTSNAKKDRLGAVDAVLADLN